MTNNKITKLDAIKKLFLFNYKNNKKINPVEICGEFGLNIPSPINYQDGELEENLNEEKLPDWWGLTINLSEHLTEINNVFQSDDFLNAGSDEEKLKITQEKLENLNTPLISKAKSIQHSLPNEFIKYAKSIDKLFNAFINGEVNTVSRPRTGIFKYKLEAYARLLEEEEKSFGLSFIAAIYECTFSEFFPRFVDHYERVKKNSIPSESKFDLIKDMIISEEGSLELKRSTLANKLRKSINADFNEIAWKKHIVFNKDLEFFASDYHFPDSLEENLNELIFFLIENSEILQLKPLVAHKSKSHYYIIPPKIIKDGLKLPIFSPNLPMIVKPRDWVKSKNFTKRLTIDVKGGEEIRNLIKYSTEESNGGLWDGGYLKNRRSQIHEGISRISKKSYGIVSDESVHILNFMQNQSFRINTKYVENVLLNFTLYFKKYLESTSIDTTGYFQEGEGGVLTVLSRSEYIEYMLRIEYGENLPVGIALHKARTKHAIKYDILASISIEYIYMVFIAINFSDKKIYFPGFYDLRGRFYYHGYLITPQSNKMAKSFLDFFDISENLNNMLCDDSFNYYVNQLLKSQKPKDFFAKKKYEIGELKIVEIDATASGSSIIGGLVGSIQLMIDTNVISEDIVGNKQDPYKKIMNEIDKLYSEALPENHKFYDLFMQTREFFEDRQNTKDLVLCYNYSEGRLARTKKILYFFEIVKNIPIELLHETNREDYFLVCAQAEVIFRKALENIYPELVGFRTTLLQCFAESKTINNLKEFYKEEFVDEFEIYKKDFKSLKDSINKNKYYNTNDKKVKLTALEELVFATKRSIWDNLIEGNREPHLIVTTNLDRWVAIYRMATYHSEQVKVKTPNTKSFNIVRETDDIDLIKLKNSSIPHLIHHLDGTILAEVLIQCKELGIPIFTAHDSFYTIGAYCLTIKKLYFEAYKKILLEEDPLKVYMNMNQVGLIGSNADYFKILAENRNSVLTLINNNKYIMSSKILT